MCRRTRLKTSDGTQQGTSLPGKGWQPAGTECCVVQGRPWLRSVHRESLGRVIEPRNEYESEADTVFKVEGSKGHAATPGVSLSAGSKSRAWLDVWVPQEPGRSLTFHCEDNGAGAV